jgi:two-component system sensor histidine kinase KdpD
VSTLLASPVINPASESAAAEEILAATAHELRLPLSQIKGLVSSLRRTDVEWDDATRDEFIAEIDLEADRLTEIVESLLEHGPLQLPPKSDLATAPSRPAAVVEGALHRVRGLLDGRLLRLDLPQTLPAVRMDASQMERVLGNLIQNAAKYSPPGSAIGISARITDNAELELAVDDEGPGIPVEDRERIFEPFFRERSAVQLTVPGHGLGLAICQSIVLAHGGRIQVSEKVGGGACFSVFLPAPVRAGQFNRAYQLEDRGDDPAGDPTEHSDRRRRGANAQTPRQQSQSQRVHRSPGRRRLRGVEAHPGAHFRPAAA